MLRRALTLAALACAAPAAAQAQRLVLSEDAGRLESDAALRETVRQALWAQVAHSGGCFGYFEAVVDSSRFFPGVSIINGTCTAEHGNTLHAVAAVDSAGVVYVLDSPSGFAFLRLRHPPRLDSSADRLEYARQAMIFSGEASANARVVADGSALPHAVPARVRSRLRQFRSRVWHQQPSHAEAQLLLFDGAQLTRHDVTIARDGSFSARTRRLWRRRLASELH